MVREATKKQMLKGMRVRQEEAFVGMLHIANDTLFICEANMQNVIVIKCTLRCFEFALGLKVNFLKIQIWGLGVHEQTLLRFSDVMSCSIMTIPFTYLGLPLGGNPDKAFSSRIGKDLQNRKEGMSNKVDYNIATSLLFIIYKAPTIVIFEIKMIQKNLLWGWGQERRKTTWVKSANI